MTEKWIHRQQILQSLGRPSDLRPDLAGPVLDALRWAYPYRLQVHSPVEGVAVEIRIDGNAELARVWRMTYTATSWRFGVANDSSPVASIELTGDQAWRLLTNNYDPLRHGSVVTTGDPEIISTLMTTRAIVGMPK